MRPNTPSSVSAEDLFRTQLKNIIDMRHPLVKLSQLIDWNYLEERLSVHYASEGRPGLSIRLMVGLQLLKHIEGLSDEVVCARWERDPYMQYFCGEEYFQHRFPCERSSLTHFRHRMGEEALEVLLQESLAAAHRAKAIGPKDLKAVSIDTTVQEKAIAHPTEHGLLLKALEHLAEGAEQAGVTLRQSYRHVAKKAAIRCGRYLHAKQFNRAKRELKFLRIRVRRVVRDIRRKVEGAMPEYLEDILQKAATIAHQKRGDKNYLYAWHAPEVECISKGKARSPYEFGCKVSVATNLHPAKGGHFILHVKALHGNPYDGHTLKTALEHTTHITGCTPSRVALDKGYKGHKTQPHYPNTQIFITGQKRGMTQKIKRWLKRRAVVEPVIGHAKNEGLLGRNLLKGKQGDIANALLAATGFNLRQLLRFLMPIFYNLSQTILRSASSLLTYFNIHLLSPCQKNAF